MTGAPDMGATTTGTTTTATTTGGNEGPCVGVDLLLMIDDSAGMQDKQAAVSAALPGLFTALGSALPAGVTVRVGVTTSTFTDDPCTGPSECLLATEEDDVGYIPPTTQVLPSNGRQGRLFEHMGQTSVEFAAGADASAALAWAQGAVTAVGTAGCTREKQTAAVAYAFNPVNADRNGSFVRDAGVVTAFVIVTDEGDGSPEGQSVYRQMIVDAKSACGGADCIVPAAIYDDCLSSVNLIWSFLRSFGGTPLEHDVTDLPNYSAVLGQPLANRVADVCMSVGL
jgi:hypothetical protein